MGKRLLDIVVTHYKEEWSVVRPFFDILGAQKSIDYSLFKVWFIQDGAAPSVFPSGYFVGSPLGHSKDNFEVVTIPHKGVSAARNKGLDLADAKWIMFCDCDDCFTSIYALKFIFSVLGNEDYDLMWSTFYTNTTITGTDDQWIKMDEYNHVWIHNKFYRLEWLRKTGIRFQENLYMSEDSAFNNVLQLELKEGRVGQINVDAPLYFWCRRNGSVTTDPEKKIANVKGHFLRNLYVLNEYKRRGSKAWEFIVVRTVTDVYSMLTKWARECDPTEMEKLAADFYLENKDIIEGVSDEEFVKCLEASEREGGSYDGPRPTIEEWIERITKEVTQS